MKTPLLAMLLATIALDSHAEVTTLVCEGQSAQGEPLMDIVLALDPERKLVDGMPGRFTDSQITWKRARVRGGKVEHEDHQLNRLTGAYQWIVQGVLYAGPPPVFRCQKAPGAKF